MPVSSSSSSWSSALVLAVHCVVLWRAAAVPTYAVPTFTVEELRTGSRDAALGHVLASTGLLAVRVPVVEEDAPLNLRGLCDCDLGPHIPGGDRVWLEEEGSSAKVERATVATATQGIHHSRALPRDEIVRSCGGDDDHGGAVFEQLEQARATVHRAVSGSFLPALDRLLQRVTSEQPDHRTILPSKGGAGYDTVTDIVEDATHLEHFHVYSKNYGDVNVNGDTALDWHTDAGLFLAFVPGQSCNDNHGDNSDESFRVHAESEEKVAVFPEAINNGEAIVAVMLGAGAEHWLRIPEERGNLHLRATRHAVKMQGGDRRVWYGKMYLVPLQAVVRTSPSELTFADMRSSVSFSGTDNDNEISVGCGNTAVTPSLVDTSRFLADGGTHQDPSKCDNDANYYCWMKCAEAVTRPHVGGGEKGGGDGDGTGGGNGRGDCQGKCEAGEKNAVRTTAEHLQDGRKVYCVDPGVLDDTNDLNKAVAACTDDAGLAGGKMNMQCVNYWQPAINGTYSHSDSVVKNEGSSGSTGGLEHHHVTVWMTASLFQLAWFILS